MVAESPTTPDSATAGPSAWSRALLALVAGAMAPLAFSPHKMWLLGLVSVLGFYAALKHTSPRTGAIIGWCYGAGFFGVGVSWVYVSIHVYGNTAPAFAGFLTALFVMGLALLFAVQAWVTQRWYNQSFYLLSFSAIWVLGEWCRSWLLTGFPWLYMGYPHVNSAFAGLAPIFGVMGISFVVVLSGAALGEMVLIWRRTGSSYAVARSYLPTVLFFLWVLTSLSSSLNWVEPVVDATLDVALVQGNIDQGRKFDRDFIDDNLATYDRLTAPYWNADVIVWPETALPFVYGRNNTAVNTFAAQARRSDTTLITGIFGETGTGLHNSITSLGVGEGIYHKQKLVPFGEYVPLRSVFATLLQLFALPMSSLEKGPADQPLLTAGGYRYSPYICYEVVYPDFVAHRAASADFLVTISNDTWFGASWGPLQHLQMAAMRALENGRYLLRATNNGVSAIIDEKGHIVARTEQFQAEVLQGQLQVFRGQTPFSVWGSWPVLLFCAALLIVIHRFQPALLQLVNRLPNR